MPCHIVDKEKPCPVLFSKLSKSLLVVALLTGCGDVHDPMQVSPTTQNADRGRRVADVRVRNAVRDRRRSDRAEATRRANVEAWRIATNVQFIRDVTLVHDTQTLLAEAQRQAARPVVSAPPARHTFTYTGAGAPCDGDLPPCWRIIGTESGGRWDAYNPGGCAANGRVWGCFGPYQFGGFWAGRLGLPADLFTATHEQWIAAARALWDHGRGCSNWSAC